MTKIRLQKFLAQAGIASRRKAEVYILQGRVQVDGRVVRTMGVQIEPLRNRVLFDNIEVKTEDRVYYALHKPMGVICTNRDTHGRQKAIDLIGDCDKRIFVVGRLDVDSEGLIFITNDGHFSQCVIHPSHGLEKEYRLTLSSGMRSSDIRRLKGGVHLGDGVFRPHRFECREGDTEVSIVIHDGRNRILRRAFSAVGYRVMRLVRVRIGPVSLGRLKSGHYRTLSKKEQDILTPTS